jgi:transposase
MPAAPRNPVERELEVQQAKVTAGEIARQRRDAIAFELWQGGMTQKEVAERLDRADRAAGGSGISHGTCQKMLFRMRKAIEDELIESAR